MTGEIIADPDIYAARHIASAGYRFPLFKGAIEYNGVQIIAVIKCFASYRAYGWRNTI